MPMAENSEAKRVNWIFVVHPPTFVGKIYKIIP